ncbi:MAG: hypothetical protein JWR05_2086 [Mucilaginibacter sp.]|nr:hypothetical protein [Mucilaginibacter sp.]
MNYVNTRLWEHQRYLNKNSEFSDGALLCQ